MTTPPHPPPGAASLLAAAHPVRRDPYKLFFPLGALLSWAGVLHWLLHATGLLANYEPVFHSIAQIQGFLLCFALGFLLTAIPRRTGTAPPAGWEIAVLALAPVGTTVAAWYERWLVSELCWLAVVLVLVPFVVRRFLSTVAAKRPPNSFVWVPLSLGMGVVGAALIALGAARGPSSFWLHDLGRGLLLQGMFLGLVAGIGGMLLPLLLRGEGPPDAARTVRDRAARAAHVAAALLLFASFWVEVRWSQPAGFALRGALVLTLLVLGGRLGGPPVLPGLHRKLVWLSAWLIPAGYAIAAAFPPQHKAGLHIVFVGGFALMAFTVGTHVVLAHGGYTRLVAHNPWQVPAFGLLFLAAMLLRLLVDFDRARFFVWLGAASATFLAGTIAWAWLVLPRLLREPRPDEL